MLANIGQDYISRLHYVRFRPGNTSVSFTIQSVDDNVFEGNENFNVTILPSQNVIVGNLNQAIVNIVDDDSEC